MGRYNPESTPFEDLVHSNNGITLRDIAKEWNRRNWVKIWWCEKYNRPPNHPLLLELTEEELYLQYMSWFVREHPGKATGLGVGGNTQYVTGDKVIDELEAKVVRGKEVPDLIDLFLKPDAAKEAKQWLESRKKAVDSGGWSLPEE